MPSTVARRQLGKRLRQAREAARITAEQVEEAKICSRTTLWRNESGLRAVKDEEIWALCRYYGTHHTVTDSLIDMAAATRNGGADNDTLVSAGWLGMYLDLEQSFSGLSVWHSWLVHALLQTDRYARAVIATDNVADEEVIAARLQRRAARQAHAMSRPHRTIQLVLAEAVFTQLHLGADVLHEQYEHLVACDRLHGIDIRILPATTGVHSGIRGPFTIMDFDDEADPAVVYLEDLTGARYLDQDKHVSPYRSAFTALKELSEPIKEFQLP